MGDLMALENLERLHRRVDGSVDDFCAACDQEWPCDVMVAVQLARRVNGAPPPGGGVAPVRGEGE